MLNRNLSEMTIDPRVLDSLLSLAEWTAKLAAALGLIWGFLTKAWRPYKNARDKHLAITIREILKPELEAMAEIMDEASGWKFQVRRNAEKLDKIYEELDVLIDIVEDNRERHDETNELLDALGFSTDRRHEDERRKEEIANMINQLAERRKERRRRYD